jgi:hypothetical protein
VVSFTPRPLYPWGKSPQYSQDRRLGGPQNQSVEKRRKTYPYRDSNSNPLAVQPIASHYTDRNIPEV